MNIFKRKNIQMQLDKNERDLRIKGQEDTKHSEDKLQADCFQWFHNTYPHLRGLLYHVPNGEKRDKITANLLKAKGVVAGVPDLVFHYRARTYFFELKKPNKSGVVSDSQKKVHAALDQQRFLVWLLNDFEVFQYLIEAIVSDTSTQFTHGIPKSDYYYKHKIFDYLYNLDSGKVILIENLTEEATRSKFMNFVSEFMVEGFDKLEGFEILFTPDYKGLYKKTGDEEVKY